VVRKLLAPLLLLALALPAQAGAADPGLWAETGRSTTPLEYYQGVASSPDRNLFFDGIYTGLYRTDSALRETGRNNDVIPASVHLAERYNHIGDIAFDSREGGRVLLPLECYYPGTPEPNNCKTGSIGVADPATLQWRYYVKLDPAEIPKAMWAAVSPDGSLLWTSRGDDLLAYSLDDVSPGNAAPAGAPIKAARELKGAVPPVGITGAVFFRGRMFTAGQDGELFQVWSIDVATGERRLEIEKQAVGESEGLDVFEALGGVLHWLIQPYNEQGKPPTYGVANGTLLHFVPRGEAPPGPAAQPSRIRLRVSPSRVRRARRTRLRFKATTSVAGRSVPVDSASIRFRGRRVVTDATGVATMTRLLRKPGRFRAVARKAGLLSGATAVRVLRRRAR
jgi:hypothetical protein